MKNATISLLKRQWTLHWMQHRFPLPPFHYWGNPLLPSLCQDGHQTPSSIFTNLFHQRFEKHSMLESLLEILQQFYIQMESEPDGLYLFPGDLSTYSLQCKRCGQHVTLHGSNGGTLFHAPNAMLYHWNMIEPHGKQIHREMILMPLIFTSYENYL
jgi:hypothetical protein